MSTPREKFQKLLRELFQFDSADLDFGIYRIMNHKRAVIQQFIEKDLLNAVSEELRKGALAQEASAAERLAALSAQIKDTLGADALDLEGKLNPNYAVTKIGKEYLSLRQSAGPAKHQDELENQIFNHLFAFFSRYYDQGDFMSLRRCSKHKKYAIPYNGEEVYLHWANSDQYYIKTGENFTDYSYKHGNWTVRFKLRNADVEQNNVKGAKRFFIPKVDALALNVAHHELTLPFEYRPLVSEEEAKFGKTNIQESIIADALPHILAAAKTDADALAALAHEKRRDAENNPVRLLDHHLRTYTQKNTRDFFIHKDLKGFLERELDFYLKNEVLNLDEIKSIGQGRSQRWFELIYVIKNIGGKIISLVSQIENFQRRLFKKQKFLTGVNYCLTLDRIPKEFYAEVANNLTQVAEWRNLFSIHEVERNALQPGFTEPLSIEFLTAHPKLVIDTDLFTSDFKDRLLGSFESLDDIIDGFLLSADNNQGLPLIRPKIEGSVKCIYIDPPFNTDNDDFVYKDSYQHSSWLTLMNRLLLMSWNLLAPDGSIAISIGSEELSHLRKLCDLIFGEQNFIALITVQRSTVSGHKTINPGVVTISEFVVIYAKDKRNWTGNTVYSERSRDERYSSFIENRHKDVDEWRLRPLLEVFAEQRGIPKKVIKKKLSERFAEEINAFVYTHADQVCQLAIVRPENVGEELKAGLARSKSEPDRVIVQKRRGYKDAYFTKGKGIIFYSDKVRQLGERQSTVERASDIWLDVMPNDLHNEGGVELKKGKKPEAMIKRLLDLCSSEGDLVLDFFLGSGTTAAVATKTGRRWMGIEMAPYFKDKPLRRLKYVLNGESGGISKDVNWHGNGAFCYGFAESYEDALDNISFRSPPEQPLLQMDDYVINYMVDFETKDSETFLNVSKLDSPFDYKLHRHGRDEQLPVDLPETFNYLIGLHVRTRRVYQNNGARYLVYRGKSKERETVIIWRTTRGWGQKEFEADRIFIENEQLAQGAEDIFVNTDSFIPGAHSLDPVFKRLMFNDE